MRHALAGMLLAVGLGVFLVRLHHPGPYWPPEGGHLLAALAALVCGGWLIADARPGTRLRRTLDVLAFLAMPIILFFSTYAILAEVEEVVVLESAGVGGEPVVLRLWIMDEAESEAESEAEVEARVEWINMGREKAQRARLDGAEVRLWRGGEPLCRRTTVVDDRAVRARTNRLGVEKYTVKRLAIAVGLFPEVAPPEIVSIRLAACASSADQGAWLRDLARRAARPGSKIRRHAG